MVEKMIADASSVHEVYSEYLSEETNSRVQQAEKNPFQSKYVTVIESQVLDSEPAIILSPLFTQGWRIITSIFKTNFSKTRKQDYSRLHTRYQEVWEDLFRKEEGRYR